MHEKVANGDLTKEDINESAVSVVATDVNNNNITSFGLSLDGTNRTGLPSRHAEPHALEQITKGDIPSDNVLSLTVRPRNQTTIIPVCNMCQNITNPFQFPPGTPFNNGGRWSGMRIPILNRNKLNVIEFDDKFKP